MRSKLRAFRYALAVADHHKLLLNIICSVPQAMKACLVLPLATGMTMTLTLLTLRQQKPEAQYVLWPRIDQKSCFKAILTSGFKAIVIPMMVKGDEVCTDMAAIESKIEQLGADKVLCVLSTTSCFSPRCPDDVESIAKVCAKTGVFHVINNAYGLQSSKACHIIDQACRRGRVDACIQSTDKNFMCPVGGAILSSSNKKMVEAVSKVRRWWRLCRR
jgi:O-phospho-L-seryl-tRNASec:L-selenocysteinyl-tRNA synthase